MKTVKNTLFRCLGRKNQVHTRKVIKVWKTEIRIELGIPCEVLLYIIQFFRMPTMVTTRRMVDAMIAVLRDGDLKAEERDLLERFGPTAKGYPMDVIELLRRK